MLCVPENFNMGSFRFGEPKGSTSQNYKLHNFIFCRATGFTRIVQVKLSPVKLTHAQVARVRAALAQATHEFFRRYVWGEESWPPISWEHMWLCQTWVSFWYWVMVSNRLIWSFLRTFITILLLGWMIINDHKPAIDHKLNHKWS